MVAILAHQGGAGQWPGNSLQAFAEIAKRSVEGVELDVHRLADGRLVVHHDPSITVGTTRRALSSLRAGDLASGAAPPGLDEVLSLLGPTRLDLQIDVKTDEHAVAYPDLLPALVRLLRERDLAGRSIISSFSIATLREARGLAPEIRLRAGLMMAATEQLGGAFAALAAYAAEGVGIVDVNLQMIDARIIDAVKRHGMQCGVATVNGEAALGAWLARPIDRLITDEPDLALRLRG